MTELDAVNRILMFTGEAPVSSLATPRSPSTAAARTALAQAVTRLCQRPSFWNTEYRQVTPDTDTGEVTFGPEVVGLRPIKGYADRFTLRSGKLYDRILESSVLSSLSAPFWVAVVRSFTFDELPGEVQDHATSVALKTVASGLGDNVLLATAQDEYVQTMRALMRFEHAPGREFILTGRDAAPFRGVLHQ